MKRKRLTRDLKWGFQHFPYYQMTMDTERFRGLAAVIRLTDGADLYWTLEKAGRAQVAGAGMIWLQLVPRGTHRLITAMLKPVCADVDEGARESRTYRVTVWYVDVIEKTEFDEDGVAAYIDKYLDVIATPQGDLLVDDRDELDDALDRRDITKEQYDDALEEADRILEDLFRDVRKTEAACLAVLDEAFRMIAAGQCTLSRNAENG